MKISLILLVLLFSLNCSAQWLSKDDEPSRYLVNLKAEIIEKDGAYYAVYFIPNRSEEDPEDKFFRKEKKLDELRPVDRYMMENKKSGERYFTSKQRYVTENELRQ